MCRLLQIAVSNTENVPQLFWMNLNSFHEINLGRIAYNSEVGQSFVFIICFLYGLTIGKISSLHLMRIKITNFDLWQKFIIFHLNKKCHLVDFKMDATAQD